MLQMQMQNKKQQEQMKLKGQEYDRMDDLFQKNPQLLIKLVQLRQNSTPQQFSFAGISMDSVDLRLVARTLKSNKSLRNLHLTRKGLKDQDGVFLFKRLVLNHQLQKVELQGHQFESSTAQTVGEYLANNKDLKYLDLEFNFLTRGDVGQTGIQKLADGLKKNENLISLNLNNNSINYQGAAFLQQALEVNTTLIHFDFEMNSQMPLANVRQIKQYLIRNKVAYDAQRFEQYLERRQLRKQEQDMDILMNNQAAGSLEKEAIEERKNARLQARDQLWKQEITTQTRPKVFDFMKQEEPRRVALSFDLPRQIKTQTKQMFSPCVGMPSNLIRDSINCFSSSTLHSTDNNNKQSLSCIHSPPHKKHFAKQRPKSNIKSSSITASNSRNLMRPPRPIKTSIRNSNHLNTPLQHNNFDQVSTMISKRDAKSMIQDVGCFQTINKIYGSNSEKRPPRAVNFYTDMKLSNTMRRSVNNSPAQSAPTSQHRLNMLQRKYGNFKKKAPSSSKLSYIQNKHKSIIQLTSADEEFQYFKDLPLQQPSQTVIVPISNDADENNLERQVEEQEDEVCQFQPSQKLEKSYHRMMRYSNKSSLKSLGMSQAAQIALINDKNSQNKKSCQLLKPEVMTQRRTYRKIKLIAKRVQKKLDGSFIPSAQNRALVPKSHKNSQSARISSYCTPRASYLNKYPQQAYLEEEQEEGRGHNAQILMLMKQQSSKQLLNPCENLITYNSNLTNNNNNLKNLEAEYNYQDSPSLQTCVTLGGLGSSIKKLRKDTFKFEQQRLQYDEQEQEDKEEASKYKRSPSRNDHISVNDVSFAGAKDRKDFISQKYTSFDLVAALIRRTIDIGITLNLVSDINFKWALRRAKECDQERKEQKPLSLLHGIPISLKDQISLVETSSNWCRSFNLDSAMKTQDAMLVKILKNLGAIPFVKSTTPVLPSIFTNSHLWGTAKNPWNLNRTPGGSSGGEGGLVSADCSIIGIGTDSGGSVRIPAAYCGIVAFYPTPSRMPYGKRGGMLQNEKDAELLVRSVPGPLGRNVSDIESFMRSIYSEESFKMDYSILPIHFNEEMMKNQNNQIRVGIWLDEEFIKICPSVHRALQMAVQVLERKGYKVVRDFKFSSSIRQIFKNFMKVWTIDQGKILSKQIIQEPTGNAQVQSSVGFSKCSRACIDSDKNKLKGMNDRFHDFMNGEQNGYQYHQTLIKKRELIDQIFQDLAGLKGGQRVRENVDIILSPASPFPAPQIAHTSLFFMTICYFALANFAQLPAGTLPITTVREGEDKWDPVIDGGDVNDMLSQTVRSTMKGSVGLPINLQVMGMPCRDEMVIQAMKDLESGINFTERAKACD